MAKSKKRRVTRVGAKHRLYITIEQDTFEALQDSGEREGFSISALAQRVIIRAVANGLIDDTSPTPYDRLLQTYMDQQVTWQASVDLVEEKNDELLEAFTYQTKVIVKQAKELAKYKKDRL